MIEVNKKTKNAFYAPTYTVELKTRISKMIKIIGGVRKAARYADISEDSLVNWREGKTKPNFFGMQGLAKAADVSLEWLATGKEVSLATNDSADLNQNLFIKVIRWTENILEEEGIEVIPSKKADLYLVLYDIAQESNNDDQMEFNKFKNIIRLFK